MQLKIIKIISLFLLVMLIVTYTINRFYNKHKMYALIDYSNITLKELPNKLQEKPYPIKHYGNKQEEKIIIVSHYTISKCNSYIKPVIKNHQEYAKKHGYDYWFRNGVLSTKFIDPKPENVGISIRFYGLYWQKIIAIKQAMDLVENHRHKYAWIFWIDTDAAFTDFNKSLDQLKQEININNTYLVTAKDMSCDDNNFCLHGCINAGVMLFRNNAKSRQLIDNIINSHAMYPTEQQAINDYIYGFLVNQDNKMVLHDYHCTNICNLSPISGIMVVNARVMNSGYNHTNAVWQPGDFIMHFAGVEYRDRKKIIPKFLSDLKLY